MFYSHQLLARKAPLGQIWMAATMHARINRRKLDKLNIIKICEEILNPSVPMALRLSGILMGGVVIVYERKVKLLYDDVTRLLVEINEAWKMKKVLDPTLLPKGKSHAKKEAVTLPEKEETNIGEIEQSLQFSNATTTTGFQQTAYFAMRLDSVNEPYIDNGATKEDPSQLHQADAENITLFERFDSFQTNADAYNRFERFDIEGDEETLPNFTSGDNTLFPTTLIPSPPLQDDQIGKREEEEQKYPLTCCSSALDMIQDQHPGEDANKQSEERIEARQDHGGRGYMTRKRRQPAAYVMDYEQTIIPGHTYQFWLQNTSDIVSRRGRKRKRTNIMTTKKIARRMELPPVVLIGDLFTNENRDIYYPRPLLELWIRSTQPPQDSPSDRISTPQPPEPSFSSHPQAYNQDFKGFPFEDYERGVDSQLFGASMERLRNNDLHNEIHMDELRANLDDGLRMPEATPKITPGNSGDGAFSIPSSVSEHGPASHSDISSGRSRKKRDSSSKNSGNLLEPVAEETSWQDFGANFKLARLSENGLNTDQELLVETAPTQTQGKISHPVDKMTDSVRTQMKAHFDAPGAPEVESLDVLATGMNRRTTALLFYQTCVLATLDFLKVEQKVPYGEILISRGSKL